MSYARIEDRRENERRYYRRNIEKIREKKRLQMQERRSTPEGKRKNVEATLRSRKKTGYRTKSGTVSNDATRAATARYHRKNPHRAAMRRAMRRAAELNATPKWLTSEHMAQIRQIYKNRLEGHHVDHIVPLQGETVCGFHVPWNLQVLPALENISKGNKL